MKTKKRRSRKGEKMITVRLLSRESGKLWTSFKAPLKWRTWLEQIAAEKRMSMDDVFEKLMREHLKMPRLEKARRLAS